MKWNNITLYQFQQIERVNADRQMDAIDKALFSTCIVYGYTEFELDAMDPVKASKLLSKMSKVFESKFTPLPVRWLKWYQVNYDVAAMTFGQYIELSFFLQQPVPNAHYILASITNRPLLKNDAKEHKAKADKFLHSPITKVMGCLNSIIESFQAFNKEYTSFFGLDKEVTGEVQQDVFNKRYGWIYAASQIAEYERVTLDEAFKLPVRQAFNDLAYLKAKVKYESEQLNKK